MKAVIRAQNSKAALSLEYGFGLLAHGMTDKRADTTLQASQLADRVDAVLSTLDVLTKTIDAPPNSPKGPMIFRCVLRTPFCLGSVE